MRLSHDQREAIHAKVREAEAKTSAHLAVTIVPVADRYALYPLLWGAMAAFLVGAGLALFKPELSLRLGLVFEAAAFVIGALILEPYALRLRVVPHGAKRMRASQLAHREFAARILGPGREGILVFAALGERHVEILATRHIHQAVGDAAWDDIAARFSASAGQGRLMEAAETAIADCAGHLATHFPR
ncbi:MAG TPA: hypothetical protein VGG48_05725 [Rhizomicrobium sp.]|jgi:putative membrane protein